MRYFRRVGSLETYKIWSLFKDLDPSKDDVEVFEILRSAKSRSIDLDSEFNLRAYARSIRDRDNMMQHSDPHLVPFLPNYEDGQDLNSAAYGLTEEQIQEAHKTATGFKDTFDYTDLAPTIKREISTSELTLITNNTIGCGINLEIALKESLRGNAKASESLRIFLENFPEYTEAVLDYIREVQMDESEVQ